MKRGIHANSSIAQTALSGANESDSHFVFTHALLENVLASVHILNHYTSSRLAEWTLLRSPLLYDGLQHQIEQKESRNPRGNHCLNKESNLFLLRVQLLIRFHREIPPSQGGVVNLLVPRWLALGRQAIVQQQLLVFDLRNADQSKALSIITHLHRHSHKRVGDHVVVRHFVHKLLGRDIPVGDEIRVHLSLSPRELERHHHHVRFERGARGVGGVVHEMTQSHGRCGH